MKHICKCSKCGTEFYSFRTDLTFCDKHRHLRFEPKPKPEKVKPPKKEKPKIKKVIIQAKPEKIKKIEKFISTDEIPILNKLVKNDKHKVKHIISPDLSKKKFRHRVNSKTELFFDSQEKLNNFLQTYKF